MLDRAVVGFHIGAENHAIVAETRRHLPYRSLGSAVPFLAGHSPDGNDPNLLIDSHGAPVVEAVWQLYRWLLERTGPRPTLVEWDNDISDWRVLFAETRKAAATLFRLSQQVRGVSDRFLIPLALLALRLPVAFAFWRSGRTRVEGWNIFELSDSQAFLFEHEFGLPFPEFMAHVTAISEHPLPLAIVVGLFTRLGALGMLVMTTVIQVFVYPDAWTSLHMYWAVILLAVLALGPGKLSLDHLLHRHFIPSCIDRDR